MLASSEFIQQVVQNNAPVSVMQAQADLNGDGTDEVLVSSHGTTIQARLLYLTLTHCSSVCN